MDAISCIVAGTFVGAVFMVAIGYQSQKSSLAIYSCRRCGTLSRPEDSTCGACGYYRFRVK